MASTTTTTTTINGDDSIQDSSKTGNVYTMHSKDGHFHRQHSTFRSPITPSSVPDSPFPAAPDRYVLYVSMICPWAHRALILRRLKHLDSLIQVVVMDYELGPEGWFFSGRDGTAEKDPLYGYTKCKELYLHADPQYDARYTVPFLWDKANETIVNNESSEIVRMLETAFDEFLPESEREATKGEKGLYPEHLRSEIDQMNEWVYDKINNGVYKTGFAATQEAYEAHVVPLFDALDRVERHLQDPEHQPYLFGQHITEADVRLFTTLIRFDAAYFTLFKCNMYMIRDEGHYPRLHWWLRNLYWNHEEFRETTDFEQLKKGYATAIKGAIVPVGPVPHIMPLSGK
ncbi:MAG: hypothetical protein LQ338_000653 [Usnochroma carphineum]|nr:MAG: hypothetical protein LQ338_000653 [Usnochroma carphineum]